MARSSVRAHRNGRGGAPAEGQGPGGPHAAVGVRRRPTSLLVHPFRRLPAAGSARDAGCRGSSGSGWQPIAVPGQVSPAVSPRATQPTKKSGEGRRSDCPRNRFTRHTLMSSVGALDSRRANAQESGCQIGSPNVASTIVSAHSPPRKSATSRSRAGMSTTTYVRDPELPNAWSSNLRTRSRLYITARMPVQCVFRRSWCADIQPGGGVTLQSLVHCDWR